MGTAGNAQNHETTTTTIKADSPFTSGATALVVDATGAGGNLEAFRAIASGGFSGITAFGGGSVSAPGAGVVAIGGGLAGPSGLVSGQGLNATGSGGSPGVYATGSGNGAGVSATGGTGVAASGALVGGGSGYGVVAAGAGSTGPPATPPTTAAVVALGGTLSNGFGTFGGPGLYAVGGPAKGQIQLAPASSAGPPSSNNQKGELWVDSNATLWICTASAVFDLNGSLVSPSVWAPLLEGGLNNALFTAVSTGQYTLTSSNGATWVDLDGTNLKLTITPSFNCQAILSGNSDLWTSTAGFNQDLGITINGGAYPTAAGQPEAWKESGGFAGTFSPNAAFVETVKPLVAGTTYTIKLQWKANKPATGATIWASAGPIPKGSSTFSPTRLTALLIVSA